MALTATELAEIRDTTGATLAEYTDAKIQAQYDLALVAAPDTASVFPYTYVYVLRRLWAIRSITVDRFTDHGDRELRSQALEAVEKLLKYWEKITGLTGGLSGGLQSGTISLGLDEPEPVSG
jgi:hypothetical protein